jgi:ribosomal protein S18 acetylase RimI-like enzyme
MPRLSVRRATPADLPIVVRFRLALLRHHARRIPGVAARVHPRAADRARRHAARCLADPTERTWLAHLDATPVGVLRCTVSANSAVLRPVRYGYLAMVYVAPAARRHGVLRRLVRVAERWCARQGLDEVRLHVHPANPDGVAAWDALGFDVVEQVRARRLGERP